MFLISAYQHQQNDSRAFIDGVIMYLKNAMFERNKPETCRQLLEESLAENL